MTCLFLGVVSTEYGVAQPASPMDEHPRLTENEYRLVAEQSQKSAADRQRRKALRVKALNIAIEHAQVAGDLALRARLAAVLERLEAPVRPVPPEERWSRAHGRKMTMRGLWNSFGAKLHDPAVVAEFDAHAWRVARLERARRVADALPDADRQRVVREEVTALLAAEGERHQRELERLLGLPLASAPPKSTGASEPTSATAAPPSDGSTHVSSGSASTHAGRVP